MLKITSDQHQDLVVDLIGCDSLPEVRCLRAEGIGLKEFSLEDYLINVEDVNISNNKIEKFVGATYMNIKRLDCSNNRISDIKFLVKFPFLTHLDIFHNLLKDGDDLFAVALCPQLICLNGASVSNLHSINKSWEEKLWPQVLSLWKENGYENLYKSSFTALQFAELRRQFESKVHKSTKQLCLESSYPEFLKFKISTLITKLMVEIRQNKNVDASTVHLDLSYNAGSNYKHIFKEVSTACDSPNEKINFNESSEKNSNLRIRIKISEVEEFPTTSEQMVEVMKSPKKLHVHLGNLEMSPVIPQNTDANKLQSSHLSVTMSSNEKTFSEISLSPQKSPTASSQNHVC